MAYKFKASFLVTVSLLGLIWSMSQAVAMDLAHVDPSNHVEVIHKQYDELCDYMPHKGELYRVCSYRPIYGAGGGSQSYICIMPAFRALTVHCDPIPPQAEEADPYQ